MSVKAITETTSESCKYLKVLCTVPDSVTAERIAARLVSAKLAACVNIVAGIESVYEWQGKIERSHELLLIIKTQTACYAQLEARLVELHPYDTPEIIATPITHGLSDYLDWVGAVTQA